MHKFFFGFLFLSDLLAGQGLGDDRLTKDAVGFTAPLAHVILQALLHLVRVLQERKQEKKNEPFKK